MECRFLVDSFQIILKEENIGPLYIFSNIIKYISFKIYKHSLNNFIKSYSENYVIFIFI